MLVPKPAADVKVKKRQNQPAAPSHWWLCCACCSFCCFCCAACCASFFALSAAFCWSRFACCSCCCLHAGAAREEGQQAQSKAQAQDGRVLLLSQLLRLLLRLLLLLLLDERSQRLRLRRPQRDDGPHLHRRLVAGEARRLARLPVEPVLIRRGSSRLRRLAVAHALRAGRRRVSHRFVSETTPHPTRRTQRALGRGAGQLAGRRTDCSDAATVATVNAALRSALGASLPPELAAMTVRDMVCGARGVLAGPALFALDCAPDDVGLYLGSRYALPALRVAAEVAAARASHCAAP